MQTVEYLNENKISTFPTIFIFFLFFWKGHEEDVEQGRIGRAGGDDVDYEYLILRSYIEVREALKKHSDETDSKFCVSKRTRLFGTEGIYKKNTVIHFWMFNEDLLSW